MMSGTEWHGMPVEAFVANNQAPARPGAIGLPMAEVELADRASIRYAHVHFSGNYGANFCSQHQTHDAYRITKDEARHIAWSLYGMCGHKIYFYDSDGNLVAEE